MMTDYKARAKVLASGACSGNEAMRTVILDMVNDGIPEAEAERLIIETLWDVFACDDPMEYLNDYRELRLRKGEGCLVETPEGLPDPMTVEQFAQYIGKSKQWCYNNTKILPKTQGKRGTKMVFYKRDADKWLAKRLNKEA